MNRAQGLYITLIFMCGLHMAAHAGTIYKWRDSSGKLHFTDNKANIPLDNQDVEIKNIQSTQVSVLKSQPKQQGKQVWKEKCSSCHFIDPVFAKKGQRGLPASILNPDTDIDTIAKDIADGLKLRSGDMNNVTLTKEELRALSQYIQETTHPKH